MRKLLGRLLAEFSPRVEPRADPGKALTLCYFTNVYPAPSHTTMRREISALEGLGVEVVRVAARRFNGPLVDAADQEEAKRTAYTADSPTRALAALLGAAIRHPLGLCRALRDAVLIGRKARAGIYKHLMYFGEACVLLRLARRCEHVHANFGNATSIATLSRVLGGPPISLRIHGPEEFETFVQEEWDWKASNASLLAPICQYGCERLQRVVATRHHQKIRMHRCGIDLAFSQRVAVPPVAASHRLVCVARMESRKGHAVLLDALAQLHEAGLPASLLLIGDGPTRAELERRARELAVAHAVEFAGWKTSNEVAAAMAAARVVVLPSFAEGLPIVLMEALSMGRAVVATSVAGIPELVIPTKTGWLVPAGDAIALAAALRTVLLAPDAELQSVGVAGRRLVRAQHDVVELMRGLLADIRACLQQGERR